jgi:hypothetical protein
VNTVPIKSFSDVILFELQKRLLKQLTFSEMWGLFMEMAPNLEYYRGRSNFKNFVARDIYDAVEELEPKKLILVTRRRLGRYQRILQIDATLEGKLYLEKTIFTHHPHSCSADRDPATKIDFHK